MLNAASTNNAKQVANAHPRNWQPAAKGVDPRKSKCETAGRWTKLNACPSIAQACVVDEPAVETDALRVREVYARRAASPAPRIYDPFTQEGLWGRLEVERHLLWALGTVFGSAETMRSGDILEVGCGTGGHLFGLLSSGASPNKLHGIDILADRIAQAKSAHPGIDFRVGNAAELPWGDRSFRAVIQLTCLSSILDRGVRVRVAQEMQRVLEPGGSIVSFDFVWNPKNNETVGISRAELIALFPESSIESRRVFLAPPISRRLVKRSRVLAVILDAIPLLCLHRIAVIKPRQSVPATARD